MRPNHNEPSWESQVSDWVLDLLSDADHAERQAVDGPFYPERGITPESLRAYASACRVCAKDPEVSLQEALRGSG
jgi:hypothetical protein